MSALYRPTARQFLEFTLNNGERLVKLGRQVPLSGADYKSVLARFQKVETGTVLDGASERSIDVARFFCQQSEPDETGTRYRFCR
jgi:hypothetical protein